MSLKKIKVYIIWYYICYIVGVIEKDMFCFFNKKKICMLLQYKDAIYITIIFLGIYTQKNNYTHYTTLK